MNTYIIMARKDIGEEPPLEPVYTVFQQYGFAHALETALKTPKLWCTNRPPKVGDVLIVKLAKHDAYKTFILQSENPWTFDRPSGRS